MKIIIRKHLGPCLAGFVFMMAHVDVDANPSSLANFVELKLKEQNLQTIYKET